MPVDLDHQSIEHLLGQAGQLLETHFTTKKYWQRSKDDGSVVTKADHDAHSHLVDGLKRLHPDIPIVSEEDSQVVRENYHEYFLLDPLDGTEQFVSGHKEFCISLAFIRNKAPLFGYLYQPMGKRMWFGDVNECRSWRKIGSEIVNLIAQPPSLDRIRTEGFHLLQGRNSSGDRARYAKRLGKSVALIRKVGSAIKCALVAEGNADAYVRFHSIYQWDIAAGHAIIRALGGDLVSLSMHDDGTILSMAKPFTYGYTKKGWESTPFLCAHRTVLDYLNPEL